MSAIIKALVTEKSLKLADIGQYTFVIDNNANKETVANEISRLYKVVVESVQTIHIAGKQKRRGRVVGKRSDIRKAIVTVKKGQKITEFSVGE